METAIGVFSLRERAEEAVRELIAKEIPESSIVFLTRSHADATDSGAEVGTPFGGLTRSAFGMSPGVIAETLLVPGIGLVFSLGFGATGLLGLTRAGGGADFDRAVLDDRLSPPPNEKCSEDAELLREVLREGRSIVVVRSESREVANAASGILDRRGIAIIHGQTPLPMNTAIRQVQDIAIVDLSGRITVAEGNVLLRNVVRDLIDRGITKILLNLHDVGYVDSSGLGELVRAHTSVRNKGGQLKLVNLSMRVNDLMHITMLHTAFDIQADEASAIQSFSSASSSRAVA